MQLKYRKDYKQNVITFFFIAYTYRANIIFFLKIRCLGHKLWTNIFNYFKFCYKLGFEYSWLIKYNQNETRYKRFALLRVKLPKKLDKDGNELKLN